MRTQAVGIGEVAMHEAHRHSTVKLSEDVTSLLQGGEINPEVCAADLVDVSPVHRSLHIFSVSVRATHSYTVLCLIIPLDH